MNDKTIKLKDFLDDIKNIPISDCYIKDISDDELLNLPSIDEVFDYGAKQFVIELANGKKIIFNGSEWNFVYYQK